MDIPILYHTFDATGVSMHFSGIGFIIAALAVGFTFILIGMLPYFIYYIIKKPGKSFIKWFNKVGDEFILKKLFLAIFMGIAIISPFFSSDTSKFFTSKSEGNIFLKPNIFYKDGSLFSFVDLEFYEKWGENCS